MDKIVAFLRLLFPLLVFALLASAGADAQVARETPLMTRALSDVPDSSASPGLGAYQNPELCSR
jgi:hypothetical protein